MEEKERKVSRFHNLLETCIFIDDGSRRRVSQTPSSMGDYHEYDARPYDLYLEEFSIQCFENYLKEVTRNEREFRFFNILKQIMPRTFNNLHSLFNDKYNNVPIHTILIFELIYLTNCSVHNNTQVDSECLLTRRAKLSNILCRGLNTYFDKLLKHIQSNDINCCLKRFQIIPFEGNFTFVASSSILHKLFIECRQIFRNCLVQELESKNINFQSIDSRMLIKTIIKDFPQFQFNNLPLLVSANSIYCNWLHRVKVYAPTIDINYYEKMKRKRKLYLKNIDDRNVDCHIKQEVQEQIEYVKIIKADIIRIFDYYIEIINDKYDDSINEIDNFDEEEIKIDSVFKSFDDWHEHWKRKALI